jgi:hypothetical protein
MLSDSRFWMGVAVGVVGVYVWHVYQARKSG